MYKTILKFTDLKDGNRVYNVGDVYPRKGYTPSADRLKELSGKSNRVGVPLIREVRRRKKA